MIQTLRLLSVGIVCVCTFAACGDNTAPPPDPQAVDTIPAWSTQPLRYDPADSEISVLVDVEAADQSDRERIVFSFARGLPGIDAGYAADSVRQCGSGRTVSLAGSDPFTIRFYPAAAHKEGTSTISSRSFDPNLPLVREAIVTCDFEGNVTWALGLSSQAPYRIITDSTRTQIILEFRN